MIPVLGVPILNRGDLLLDLVNSIDFPVEKLAIVQNGNEENVVNAIEQIKSGINPHVRSVYVSIPFRNLGVAPSWNHIIKSFPEVPFILIPGNDIKFSPGDLEKIYNAHVESPDSFIFVEGFACFGITPHVIETVGLFDENIYPAYYEDNDYHHRIKLLELTPIHVNTNVIHQNGSQTIRSNIVYNNANGQTFPQNMKYYADKWGENAPRSHDFNLMYKHPFNDSTKDADYWKYDPKRRTILCQAWRMMDDYSNKVIF